MMANFLSFSWHAMLAAAATSNTTYQLAYIVKDPATEGSVNVRVATGISPNPPSSITTINALGARPGAQPNLELAVSPDGHTLAAVAWRADDPICKTNKQPAYQSSCPAIAIFSSTASTAENNNNQHFIPLEGDATIVGQLSFSPSGETLSYVTQSERSSTGGSWWNVSLATGFATMKSGQISSRVVQEIFVPSHPGSSIDPLPLPPAAGLHFEQCIHPSWMEENALVFATFAQNERHQDAKIFRLNTTTGDLLDLYWYSNTTKCGPATTAFCRPVVHPTGGNVAVTSFHINTHQAWVVEVLDPDTYGYEGVQPDSGWPLAGGATLMGGGQLAWNPAGGAGDMAHKEIAIVEFNVSWEPHPPSNSTCDAAMVSVMAMPHLKKKRVAVLANPERKPGDITCPSIKPTMNRRMTMNSSSGVTGINPGNQSFGITVSSGAPSYSPVEGTLLAYSSGGKIMLTEHASVGGATMIEDTGFVGVWTRSIAWVSVV